MPKSKKFQKKLLPVLSLIAGGSTLGAVACGGGNYSQIANTTDDGKICVVDIDSNQSSCESDGNDIFGLTINSDTSAFSQYYKDKVTSQYLSLQKDVKPKRVLIGDDAAQSTFQKLYDIFENYELYNQFYSNEEIVTNLYGENRDSILEYLNNQSKAAQYYDVDDQKAWSIQNQNTIQQNSLSAFWLLQENNFGFSDHQGESNFEIKLTNAGRDAQGAINKYNQPDNLSDAVALWTVKVPKDEIAESLAAGNQDYAGWQQAALQVFEKYADTSRSEGIDFDANKDTNKYQFASVNTDANQKTYAGYTGIASAGQKPTTDNSLWTADTTTIQEDIKERLFNKNTGQENQYENFYNLGQLSDDQKTYTPQDSGIVTYKTTADGGYQASDFYYTNGTDDNVNSYITFFEKLNKDKNVKQILADYNENKNVNEWASVKLSNPENNTVKVTKNISGGEQVTLTFPKYDLATSLLIGWATDSTNYTNGENYMLNEVEVYSWDKRASDNVGPSWNDNDED